MSQSRRGILLGGGAVVMCAALLGYEGWQHWPKRYSPTPYDDLLERLPDRDAGRALGQRFVLEHAAFNPRFAAPALRRRIGARQLKEVLQQEIAIARLTEIGHWLLPETLAGLCALAAKT